MWVRRASMVGLLKPMRVGQTIDQVYDAARRLHPDRNDLIHKAVTEKIGKQFQNLFHNLPHEVVAPLFDDRPNAPVQLTP